MEYDEQAAVEFIRAKLPEESVEQYDDDEIINVIDMIWDYYDQNGMLEIDVDDEDDELNVTDLLDYVKKMVAKDRNSPLKTSDIEAIVNAELDYEDTLFD